MRQTHLPAFWAGRTRQMHRQACLKNRQRCAAECKALLQKDLWGQLDFLKIILSVISGLIRTTVLFWIW